MEKTRKVRVLNITGAMAYGIDESDAGKVISVEPDVADALVGMRFAEELEEPAMKGARKVDTETAVVDVKPKTKARR